jgi:hypothetical protein
MLTVNTPLPPGRRPCAEDAFAPAYGRCPKLRVTGQQALQLLFGEEKPVFF